ncbi:PepSY domain-containing protein [Prosthecobacter sp.]|uniref:PepSY domain-containing protein n=1 Tax=Prosthecobacter sp. TaxID=1965333 RepID=UPI002AB850C9|nr:PepSY domain-containing protein [Prosthecobacter sp.]MDZ4402315.1 PepSY domain-containing protein [Prosthecobacter sp.]
MNPKLLRKLHRWLGLVFSLSVLIASGSGVLHNVMTRTQAPPPQAKPSGGGMDVNAIKLSVAEAVSKISEANPEVQAVNLRGIGGQPWYQIYTKTSRGPQYVSAIDGKVDSSRDEAYAAEIVKNFLAGSEVKKTDFLTSFNSEYINIFRILPVYRFDIGDALETRVYVSTTTGSVTRHTDKQRQFEATIFTNFHKLGFIPDKNLRDLVLTVLTFGIFLVACLGIALFFATRPKKR